MKILSWNCRGLKTANSPTIPFLGWTVLKFLSQFLFLPETKADGITINKVAAYLWFPNAVTVDDVNVYQLNLILLYGSLYLESRKKVWELITYDLNQNTLDSVIMGDFNQLKFLNQKMGGLDYIPWKDQFSIWRSQIGLSEISFHGQSFTWCNNPSAAERIYERLDKA